MQVVTFLLVTCELCLAIRVPIAWDQSASEVKQEIKNDNDEQFSVEKFKTQIKGQDVKPIPVQYFEYTAKKPQFAVDIAKFHGVQSPENHYKAYPIKPYTGKAKPELGKHHILDNDNPLHRPLQEYTRINEDHKSHAVPVSLNYEVFHPYEAEIPALQQLYKDPILTKIRNDLENSKTRLQNYEKEAGEADINKDEYLETPAKTDSKFIPQRNIPAPYEIHRPQRKPIYYRHVSKNPHREQYLNQKLKHPWNQYSAKIRPVNYRPVKNHIQQLRQNHALKYDDERNEYPQVHILENYSDPKDGYDIYERGKDKFLHLRNNVDESINKAVQQNHPATYKKLEIQNNDSTNKEDDEEEFVPIKNYAQVRKTETFKHLPKSAAFADAETLEEIRNAPRLREAVKSTKAQTVYSEEGYEDSAYDHAGEQKHASENEGHGGYLKEHELSGGKYKTPSVSGNYEDGGTSAYRDQILHAEKWRDDKKDNKEETDEEDYSKDEQEQSADYSSEDPSQRNKRENTENDDVDTNSVVRIENNNKTSTKHDVDKQGVNFKVPELDLSSTFLTEQEILNIGKIKLEPKKEDIKQKYPYYFKKLRALSKHSPLRYAENLKLIPKKSKGGTEFYDSRSGFECPDVEDVPDPIPDKLKRDGHPDNSDKETDSSSKGDENYDTVKKTPRLKGLGDKIDCFKAKYFGENPLDSPFFKEEIILNPEPLIVPNITSYKTSIPISIEEQNTAESKSNKFDISSKHIKQKNSDLFDLIEKLRSDQNKLQDSLMKSKDELISSLIKLENKSNINNPQLVQQSSVYSDVLQNINNNLKSEIVPVEINENVTEILSNLEGKPSENNVTYTFFQNKKDITKIPTLLRKKRSTSFVYEPYKIIRDGQVQDSKKTTTSSNISPLIRQLQSSKVVDRVTKPNQEAEQAEKHVKRNVNSHVYKDIGKRDREPIGSKNAKSFSNTDFVDVSVDTRRGEPRYEIVGHANHKSSYTPVENKKSMSIDDYTAHTSTNKESETKSRGDTSVRKSKIRSTTVKPSFDVSKFIPPITNIQNIAESNTVKKTVSTTTVKPSQNREEENGESDDDYEEYDEEDEEEDDNITTTTTTPKPSFRQKNRLSTTTEKLPESTERPKLKLITRFRDYKPDDTEEPHTSNHNIKGIHGEDSHVNIPKYREKKKKSTKRTLVTDTKSYGDDDHNMRKEEVDALIGVKHDMDDYMPSYEKEEQSKAYKKENEDESGDDDSDEEDYDDDDDDDDNNDDEYDDDDDSDDDEDETDEEGNEPEPEITTPEPTKRTLAITTDAPAPTTATRNAKLEAKPIVTKKKIEIHKELPANKSSPHLTQYKQDIKEVEIIKELPMVPKKKPQKNLEALELYRDDNLAKDINKLGGVEVFKEDIDLKNGPKHGGNYKSAVEEPNSTAQSNAASNQASKEDTEASQSEFTKHIEFDDNIPKNQMHGGNLKSIKDIHKTRSRGRSAKLIELSEPPTISMHGGNLKHRGRGRNSEKSQKLIEFDDEHEQDDDDSSKHPHNSFGSFRNSRPMHGGNYRNAKIEAEEATEPPKRGKSKDGRRSAAVLLNSFVQAAPILTTTPAYILDPSKRMYYYVDA